jgi:hypothetical protein
VRSKQGRWVPLLAACVLGYVVGAWHVTALRSTGHSSAAETIAVRFPQTWSATAAAVTLADIRGSRTEAELFSPVPMVQPSRPQATADASATGQPSADPRLVASASLENVVSPVSVASESATHSAVRSAAKPPARPVAASRPGYILNDAQIAGIKQRLHLTPDQERMWPAVEAALRNMAYKRTQQAAARGATRNVAAVAVDPEAVEGLKSAAVPLIMSFSSEQKDEVRSLVHVMGLDQLAAQF